MANKSTSEKKASSTELDRATRWWKKINYGGGHQGFYRSCELYNPEFLVGFSANEITVLETFTFIAWKMRDWEIEVSLTFLEVGLASRGISRETIKRAIKKWIAAGYLRCLKRSYTPGVGSLYLVSSELMQKSQRDELMKNHELAANLTAQAKAKAKKAQTEAEDHRKWVAAEELKAQRRWAAAVREAKAAGLPLPALENYTTNLTF